MTDLLTDWPWIVQELLSQLKTETWHFGIWENLHLHKAWHMARVDHQKPYQNKFLPWRQAKIILMLNTQYSNLYKWTRVSSRAQDGIWDFEGISIWIMFNVYSDTAQHVWCLFDFQYGFDLYELMWPMEWERCLMFAITLCKYCEVMA